MIEFKLLQRNSVMKSVFIKLEPNTFVQVQFF